MEDTGKQVVLDESVIQNLIDSCDRAEIAVGEVIKDATTAQGYIRSIRSFLCRQWAKAACDEDAV